MFFITELYTKQVKKFPCLTFDIGYILYNTGQKFEIIFFLNIFEVVLTKAALNWPKTQ